MSGWQNTVIGGAILAGLSGLVMAGSTMQSVADLEKKSVTASQAQVKIREDISSLKTSVQNIENEQKEVREEYREDQRELNRKLDKLLEK